jgi:hypothetical protein
MHSGWDLRGSKPSSLYGTGIPVHGFNLHVMRRLNFLKILLRNFFLCFHFLRLWFFPDPYREEQTEEAEAAGLTAKRADQKQGKDELFEAPPASRFSNPSTST